ncbi:hypothetical protein FMM05_02235 [Flavobacterium zepuense]|uniref:Outer membrane protein beta-barrel domain-containing protein n=1 Tax=Flavobacterium zepuense TaxID=2593302 RepID=A0A552VAU6_9FLAO|nr:hypothetical protein [Flavobacterium zepuense]TRW27480.1 hypothetical protein FMM05_02235 [Flavobacterium zepuense]
MSRLYFYLFVILFSGTVFNRIYAQPNTGEFINASVGLGIVAPNDESEIDGSGFYAQAEYVWAPRTWFGVRPYAGLIIASGESDEDEIQGLSIKSNAALLGAKIRLVAPIPYVAPFIESGVGMSIGSFETHTEYTNLKKDGVLLHIPFTVGLALGRRHKVEVKFTYYYHDAVDQFSGAAAFGLSFPINND